MIKRVFKLISVSLLIYSFFTYGLQMRTGFVVSGSMNPIIKTNSLVVARQIKYKDIKVGDIIVYKKYIEEFGQVENIVHRVVEKNLENLKTKGDNNNYIDEWTIVEKEIIGKVLLK